MAQISHMMCARHSATSCAKVVCMNGRVSTMTETPDQRAARLLDIGVELAVRVRDEDPNDIGRWLDSIPRHELRDMAMIVACLVPDDRPLSELLAWHQHTPTVPRLTVHAAAHLDVPPCGTVKAARRHQRRHEDMDDACSKAYRRSERERKRRARTGVKRAAA